MLLDRACPAPGCRQGATGTLLLVQDRLLVQPQDALSEPHAAGHRPHGASKRDVVRKLPEDFSIFTPVRSGLGKAKDEALAMSLVPIR